MQDCWRPKKNSPPAAPTSLGDRERKQIPLKHIYREQTYGHQGGKVEVGGVVEVGVVG